MLLGPRQVGKTTGVAHVYRAYAGPKLMVSADSPTPPDSAWIRAQWETARSLGEGALLIIDEIQKVPGWSETIKLLFDQDRASRSLQVVLLGSASLSIQNGLAESLAGRYELVRAHHWSFAECRAAFGFTFQQYLQFGGYPAAAELIREPERWRAYLKDSIIEPVLGRDILGTVRVNKPALFRQAFELAMRYPAQVVSYQKLIGQLQDRGSTETIKYHLHLLEAAFLLRQLPKYSRGQLSSRASSPKLIPLDCGLIGSFAAPGLVVRDPAWRGHVLEAAFGAYLARRPGELYYWSDGRHEVDFVHEYNDVLSAYEIKAGGERDGKGLTRFLQRYSGAKGYLIDAQLAEQMFAAESPDGLC